MQCLCLCLCLCLLVAVRGPRGPRRCPVSARPRLVSRAARPDPIAVVFVLCRTELKAHSLGLVLRQLLHPNLLFIYPEQYFFLLL